MTSETQGVVKIEIKPFVRKVGFNPSEGLLGPTGTSVVCMDVGDVRFLKTGLSRVELASLGRLISCGESDTTMTIQYSGSDDLNALARGRDDAAKAHDARMAKDRGETARTGDARKDAEAIVARLVTRHVNGPGPKLPDMVAFHLGVILGEMMQRKEGAACAGS